MEIFAPDAPADPCWQVHRLNDQAWSLSDTDPEQARVLGGEALALATGPDGSDPPCRIGMAYALRTLGYLNQRSGDYATGVTQLLQAQEMCEALRLEDGLADVFDGLAGTFMQMGDYQRAFDYAYRQLETAQRADDAGRTANAYNNLGALYFETGDHAAARETFERNLHQALVAGNPRIAFLSRANLAETHMSFGNLDMALDCANQALDTARQSGFELFEAYALANLGRIQMALGSLSPAAESLHLALSLTRRLASKPAELGVLLYLGEMYRDARQLDRALDYLGQAEQAAAAMDATSEALKAHALLAEVYEARGDLALALHHLKQHQACRELVAGEKAEQRLQVLRIAHDTESARREAEIHRLKAERLDQDLREQQRVAQVLQEAREALERQVAERTEELRVTVSRLERENVERMQAEARVKQMVATLAQRVAARTEELATFFQLATLAGRGADLAEVLGEILPRIVDVTRSSAARVDLMDERRESLVLAAEANLPDASRERRSISVSDLPQALQTWLQQPSGVLTSPGDLDGEETLTVFHEAGYGTQLGVPIRAGGRVEGVLGCYRVDVDRYAVDEIALAEALADQMGVMLEIGRLRQDARRRAVLEERQRLARDLHDSVTQLLYGLTLFSRAGREAAEDGDEARLRQCLVDVERHSVRALGEMRLLLFELRPADLALAGLTQALRMRLEAVERRSGLEIEARIDDLGALPSEYEVELYHIFIEAMNNVVKHAEARRIGLSLRCSRGDLHLQIADDGRGFDSAATGGGQGLRSMRERAWSLGGRIVIASAPGIGTRVEAVIPLPEEASPCRNASGS